MNVARRAIDSNGDKEDGWSDSSFTLASFYIMRIPPLLLLLILKVRLFFVFFLTSRLHSPVDEGNDILLPVVHATEWRSP